MVLPHCFKAVYRAHKIRVQDIRGGGINAGKYRGFCRTFYHQVKGRDRFKIFRVPDIPVDESYAGFLQPGEVQLRSPPFQVIKTGDR